MGFQSQDGSIGFITQSVDGTFELFSVAAPNNPVWMRTRGGALGANRELIIPDPEIGGDRDTPDANMGPVSYSGDIEFYGRMQSIATLLFAAFGSVSTVDNAQAVEGTDVVGTHTITPLDGGSMPLLSIEEDIAGGLDTFQYTDAVVNSLNVECEPDGYLMGTVGLIAKTALAAAITAPNAVDLTPLLVGTSMAVTISGVTAPIVRSFSLDFNNNFEDDVFQLGDIALADLTPKRRELTMGMTLRPTDVDLWREAVFGGVSEVSPQSGAAVTKAVTVNIQSFTFVGTGTLGTPAANVTPFSLDLNIPNAVIQPFNMEPNADDVIEFDLEFQAIRPDPAVDLVTATVINDLLNVR